MNNGTERDHQSVKKELGELHTGHNISFSTVTNTILYMQGRKSQVYFSHIYTPDCFVMLFAFYFSVMHDLICVVTAWHNWFPYITYMYLKAKVPPYLIISIHNISIIIHYLFEEVTSTNHHSTNLESHNLPKRRFVDRCDISKGILPMPQRWWQGNYAIKCETIHKKVLLESEKEICVDMQTT